MNFSSFTPLSALLLLVLSLLQTLPAHSQARSYTTITAVTVNALSNGVQISVRADGILQYNDVDSNGRTMGATFPDARNGTGKNFINLNRYPVSHLQLSTPQGAQGGIGCGW
jgi:hypothetical protein